MDAFPIVFAVPESDAPSSVLGHVIAVPGDDGWALRGVFYATAPISLLPDFAMFAQAQAQALAAGWLHGWQLTRDGLRFRIELAADIDATVPDCVPAEWTTRADGR
ncbi:MAG: hypothetical protein M3N95_07075 [Actinomycetota bacterium]|nr:hypothetical protein [Actinomycetota bacterium]